METEHIPAYALVVGAGPSGISMVATLLDHGFSGIVWLDPSFTCGAYPGFRGIPANTRAIRLSAFANYVKIFKKHDSNPEIKTDVFEREDPMVEPKLDLVHECLKRMTSIIANDHRDKVAMVRGVLDQIQQTETGFLAYSGNKIFEISRAFLCLGADMKSLSLHHEVPRINCYHAMSELQIEQYDLRNDVVVVYGSSHSAILALRNLVRMKLPPKEIHHVVNKNLLYAEYVMDFIRHNYTGLKGVAKQFGMDYEQGKYSHLIRKHWFNLPSEVKPTRVVVAIGFNQRKVPLIVNGQKMDYEIVSGRLVVNGKSLQNISHMGIGGPLETVDREGEKMKEIGVVAFMEHAHKLVKEMCQSRSRL